MNKILSLVPALMALAAVGPVKADGPNPVSYEGTNIVIDLVKACVPTKGIGNCTFTFGTETVNISASGSQCSAFSSYSHPGNHPLAPLGPYIGYTITSTKPIVKMGFAQYSGNYSLIWNGAGGTAGNSGNSDFIRMFDVNPGTQSVVTQGVCAYPTSIYISAGIPDFLSSDLKSDSGSLLVSYRGVLENLEAFRSKIAKSHRGHLDRLEDAVKDGIALLEAKDDKGLPLYPITHWALQENARMITVFGTILNELLADYSDVTDLTINIEAVKTLVEQLRIAYGWEHGGLAGTVSKASSSLVDAVRLEVQEIYGLKLAIGMDAANQELYLDLLKTIRNFKAAVDGDKSGDMRGMREISPLVEIWNSSSWQAEINGLFKAGPDFQNMVVPKMVMLLYAMESIEDLSKAGFTLPTDTDLRAKKVDADAKALANAQKK
jgi:hypothetical protein